MRELLAFIILLIVVIGLASVTVAQNAEQFADNIVIQAQATGAQSKPAVREECAMPPPPVQLSDRKGIV